VTLRAEKVLVSLTLGALLHPTFQAVATVASARSVPAPWWLSTPLDRALPLVPEAAWVYVSWYPASLVLFVAGRDTLRRAYLAYVAAFLICIASYLLFPVTIERPAVVDTARVSGRLLAALYAADRPINLFPSFHAAVAAILWRVRPASRLKSAAVSTWAVALCLACILTRQHYILDVIAGLAVGGIAVTVVDRARRWFAQTAELSPYSPVRSETAE
jgi:membrane-associated phospholipid phosphatase